MEVQVGIMSHIFLLILLPFTHSTTEPPTFVNRRTRLLYTTREVGPRLLYTTGEVGTRLLYTTGEVGPRLLYTTREVGHDDDTPAVTTAMTTVKATVMREEISRPIGKVILDLAKSTLPTGIERVGSTSALAEGQVTENSFTISPTDVSSDGTDKLDERYRSYVAMSVAIFVFLFLFVCGGNGLALIAFYRRPSLRTRSNFYIMQMAVADFLLGLSFLYHLALYIFPSLLADTKLCGWEASVSVFLCAASLTAIVAMNLDRFRSIIWPYDYVSTMERSDYIKGAAMVWIPSFIWGFIAPLATYNKVFAVDINQCIYVHSLKRAYFMYAVLPFVYLVLLAVLTLNVPMFYIAHKQACAIRVNAYPNPSESNNRNPEQNHFKEKFRLLKTILIIFVTFYGCWLPYCIALSMEVYESRFYNNPEHIVYYYGRFFIYPMVLNSGINPIIYVVRIRAFREEIGKVLNIKRYINSANVHP